MENNEIVYLYLDDIIPNRFQPREVFDDQALKELAISIKEHGVIQPIIVRKVENKYEIIAGERRYKASTMAGLTKIPAIVKNLDDKESSKVALIENLQRRDLTPIEEARTYQKILELESGMTQEQLAQTMGKTQSVVSNKLRLLALPDEVQDALLKEKISERHARSLLNLPNKNDQIRMLDKVVAEKMTVRELDKEIKEMNDNQESANSNITSGGGEPLVTPLVTPPSFPTPVATVQPVQQEEQPSISPIITNPTEVDINKIRENAVDINGPKSQTVDIKDLMKDVNTPANNSFKFVPAEEKSPEVVDNNSIEPSLINNSFSQGLTLGDNNSLSSQNPTVVGSSDNGSAVNKFFGDPSIAQGSSVLGNNIASTIPGNTFNLNPVASTSKDVAPVIDDIKNTVKNIETKGYRVTVEENDTDSTYQITIKVDKTTN